MQDHFSLNIFCLLGFRHSKQQSMGAEDLPTLQTMQHLIFDFDDIALQTLTSPD